MRILLILSALVAAPAWAEWEPYYSDKDSNSYVDKTTIRKKGNIVRMWEMDTYFKAQIIEGRRHRSILTQVEYDCAEERARFLAEVAYSRANGKGDTVYSDVEPRNKWIPAVPGSKGEEALKIACGKK